MILVTGGTGFVGQEVVRHLLDLGAHVRLLIRHPEKARRLAIAQDPRVELVPGDVLKPETLPAAVAGVQAVIHLVGIIAETSRVTYEQAHFEATRNLLTAAKKAGVTRWIQMSAIGTRPTASSRYHLTKWRAETLVRESGLDWTILRPSLIYGYDERDRILNTLRLALTYAPLHCLPLIDGGTPRIQPVSVKEVAHCFALAPAKEAAIGQTYDLVGPVAFTWREMIFKILAAMGKKGLYEDVPLLLILRKLLVLSTLVVPVLLIIGLVSHSLSVAMAEIGAGLWAVLIIAAAKWRRTIVFNLPGEPLILGSELLNGLAPRELCPSEMLKMSVEDNTGDPAPSAKTFAYTPETFEQGLARIIS